MCILQHTETVGLLQSAAELIHCKTQRRQQNGETTPPSDGGAHQKSETGKAPVKQQLGTNIPTLSFYGPDWMPVWSPNQQRQSAGDNNCDLSFNTGSYFF